MSKVVLLSGPAGAGKSTAAAAWASRGSKPRAVVDADALRQFIRAGVAYPEDGWTDETQRQWDVAMDLWQAMARVYKAHGIDCVVDLYAPPMVEEPWAGLFAELDVQRVFLLPSFEVCRERNRVRNRQPFLEEHHLRGNYDDFAWCVRQAKPEHVIDNSELTLDQTVAAIEARLAG